MGCRVTKVREFQRVAKLCEADGHMQQKLKQLLKLSKEKWDAACEHAKTAVQVPAGSCMQCMQCASGSCAVVDLQIYMVACNL